MVGGLRQGICRQTNQRTNRTSNNDKLRKPFFLIAVNHRSPSFEFSPYQRVRIRTTSPIMRLDELAVKHFGATNV
jgi:hypothetical protein